MFNRYNCIKELFSDSVVESLCSVTPIIFALIYRHSIFGALEEEECCIGVQVACRQL